MLKRAFAEHSRYLDSKAGDVQYGMVRPCFWPLSARRLARGTKRKEHAMSGKHNSVIAAIGIDIGKNSFYVRLDGRGAVVPSRS